MAAHRMPQKICKNLRSHIFPYTTTGKIGNMIGDGEGFNLGEFTWNYILYARSAVRATHAPSHLLTWRFSLSLTLTLILDFRDISKPIDFLLFTIGFSTYDTDILRIM